MMPPRPRARDACWLVAAVVVAVAPANLQAQDADSLTLVAGAQYRAAGALGWLTRWVFGNRYRDLWTAPVKVEAIHPDSWRGGIRLLGADTGLRAGYLYFRDADGDPWTFRAIDRDLSELVPERLRRAVLAGALRDLYSARHPGAPLVWPTLARAAGLGVPSEDLVALMVDSAPTLGFIASGVDTRFREELYDPGAGLSTADLLALLDQPRPPPVDTLGYLRERLFDIFVGSWDPLPQEWLWTERRGVITPLPRERDGAFARFDGLVTVLAATGWAELSSFSDEYAGKLAVTARTRILDRRILTGLDPARWEPVARGMQRALSDSVIDAAVSRLPPEYSTKNGPRLAAQLRARRDRLAEAARRFRELLVDDADIYGTNAVDTLVARYPVDSQLVVSMRGRLRQTFTTRETSEVRYYPRGAGDRVEVSGSGVYGPMLVIAGDSGVDVADSSLARRSLVDRTLQPPVILDVPDAPLVHGTRTGVLPWLSGGSDIGLLLGLGLVATTHDPGHDPWQRQLRLRAGFASGPGAFGLELRGEFRLNPRTLLRVEAKASGLEILKYYGFGNETARPEPSPFYRTDQQHLVFAPTLVGTIRRGVVGEIGPVVKFVTTDLTRDNLIAIAEPYGADQDGFGQVGVQGALRIDTRDSEVFATRGALLRFGVSAYPAVFKVEEAFGAVEGSAAGTVSPSRRLTLAARVSGKWIWGRPPVHEAAFIGGSRSVRSLRAQRFAGNDAVWANLDTRFRTGSVSFGMPWDCGLLGVADLGRVFVTGERSRKWHHGLGGGFWLALPDRSFMGLVDVVAGDDGVAFGLGSSFIF